MIENIEDAITLSMQEASMMAEIEAQERYLKRASELIENWGKKQAGKQAKKQAGKLTGKHARRRAKMRARKRAMMDCDE